MVFAMQLKLKQDGHYRLYIKTTNVIGQNAVVKIFIPCSWRFSFFISTPLDSSLWLQQYKLHTQTRST